MAAPPQSGLVVAFAQALTELVTVEKKNIVVLTEIARDALLTDPQAVPSLAALITNRVLQAPPPQKLPVLYLLDSVSKMVGEPYKSLFAPSLAEVFMNTWQAGGPGLHRPLDKLLATWAGIFPDPLLASIHARVAAACAAAAPAQLQPAAAPGYGGGGGYGFSAVQPVQQAPPLQQPGPGGYGMGMQQQGPAGYGMQQPAAGYGPGYGPAYPQQQQAAYQQPAQQQFGAPPAQASINVPDLLSSLVSAGLLAAPAAVLAGGAPAALGPSGGSGLLATPPHAAVGLSAAPERELPATIKFTPERLKEHNPSAMSRLLRSTEETKSRFLDRKFLRRQQKQAATGASSSSAARSSRLWYLDLDTWLASTVRQAGGTAGAAAAAGGQAGPRGAAGQATAAEAAALDPSKHSVPVDDMQTHCALSGEAFEQFWDEGHQEWRYRGAKALDAQEAARYGLEEGAIVLVSALAGATNGGPGVLSELAAEREIADDLAAAAATAGGQAGAAEGAAGGEDAKEEKPLELKRGLEERDGAAAAGAEPEGEPAEKRQRVD